MMLDELERSGSEMSAMAAGAGLLYNGTDGTKSCFNIYDDFIECADITGNGLELIDDCDICDAR